MKPRTLCGLGAVLLVGAAVSLPVERILDFFAARYHTVAGFRADYRAGLQVLRLALALNGLALACLPWILTRCRFEKVSPDARPERWPMAVLAVLTAAIIAPGLTSSFQQDEWRCLLQYVQHGPAVILTRSVNGDNHVLYSLLEWPLVSVFGPYEIPVRLPALLFSSLAAPLLFAVLRRRFGVWPSFLASLPLSGSFFLVYWGHEGRAYGPLIAFTLALAWLQPRMLRGSLASWLGYLVLGTLAVWMHVFAATAVMALALVPLLREENRRGPGPTRNLSVLCCIGGLSLLLHAFQLPPMAGYADRSSGVARELSPLPNLLAWNFVGILSPAWAVPFAVASCLGVRRWEAPLGAATCALLLGTLLQCTNGDHAPRFYAPALGLLWIAIGHGIAATLARRMWGTILLSVLLVSTIVAGVRYYQLGKRDLKTAAAEIRLRKKPGERVAVFHDARPMGAYIDPAPPVVDEAALRAALPEWFVGVDANLRHSPTLLDWLERNYSLEFRLPSTGGEVRGYHRTRNLE